MHFAWILVWRILPDSMIVLQDKSVWGNQWLLTCYHPATNEEETQVIGFFEYQSQLSQRS
jgi:hypothetical protein